MLSYLVKNDFTLKKVLYFLYGIIQKFGFWLNYLISRSKITTQIYINFLGFILKLFPANKFKRMIVSHLNSFEQWPDINLPTQIVNIDKNIYFKIIPHFHEFDFEFMFYKDINYEKEIFEFLTNHLLNYDDIIEIGANVGIFSVFFSTFFKIHKKFNSKIFVFEPSFEAYYRLIKNIQINNGDENIYAFNCAIGEKTEFVDFFEPKGHLTNGSLHPKFAEIFSDSITIKRILKIDGNLLQRLIDNKRHILIKIDVEGYEYFVLKSLENIIQLQQPDILVEVLEMYQDKLNTLEFLFNLNYSFFNITDRGLVKYDKFVANNKFRDYILISNLHSKNL